MAALNHRQLIHMKKIEKEEKTRAVAKGKIILIFSQSLEHTIVEDYPGGYEKGDYFRDDFDEIYFRIDTYYHGEKVDTFIYGEKVDRTKIPAWDKAITKWNESGEGNLLDNLETFIPWAALKRDLSIN